MKGIFIMLLLIANYRYAEAQGLHSKKIAITWLDSLEGDYSFTQQWSYNSSIFKNNYGQLVCDGICPEQCYSMRDRSGRVYKDSMTAFYKLVDTTHWLHTLECEAWCYEFGEANYIDVSANQNGTLHLATPMGISTHSSLNLTIANILCTPTIKLISIIGRGNTPHYYYCKGGYIKIDSRLWKRGILKAEFSFDFTHPENPKKRMYWKGKIYTPAHETVQPVFFWR